MPSPVQRATAPAGQQNFTLCQDLDGTSAEQAEAAIHVNALLQVTNWGREIEKWLGGRLKPVVLDDTKGEVVKVTSRTGLQQIRALLRPG
jgi:hypothetical protein